jgi:hypothetical protein
MKTTSFSRGSRAFSSEANESQQTQMGPMPHERQEDDPMVARYSWYYEEDKECARSDERGTMDRSVERNSSNLLAFRIQFVKDSLLYRESTA